MTSIYEGYRHFLDDAEKTHDFITMSMEDFLFSYSYLDVRDYYATYDELMGMLNDECHSMSNYGYTEKDAHKECKGAWY